jgi:hypothetical protein
MSATRPVSGASNPIPRCAKSDDGTSFKGRRASREKMGLERVRISPRWADCERGHGRAQPNARVPSGHCQDDKQQ